MKIAVIGATGGTGSQVVKQALEQGHEVIAVARRPEAVVPAQRLIVRRGDVFDESDIVNAIAGADAVISCIGPPSGVSTNGAQGKFFNFKAGMRVMAANYTPGTIMSEGMANILTASRRGGVKRLVMQSGINLSEGTELSAFNRRAVRIMRRIYRKAIEDKAIAEQAVRQSNLDWVIVRASLLRYADGTLNYTAGPAARISLLRALPFADCADCLVRAAVSEPGWTGKIVNVGR
ncbi:NAD(P)H-binding protein [Saccharibacillus sp. CPCC 101409]|uniref:NAD(P)-dependent oxidoreductase n=1 Tax=Saccharibacillus sp. CPCC 101409 TaxID=3058041 RepID=UPI002671F60F|nr:NAD(P)H-binding protein [Saccharibacillus sp. CPCC 101409]MDO3413007.1 NAD(P)H-binding protein [Saccharibacillus sp. CPCC 101409]